jgi:hypothetical protein
MQYGLSQLPTILGSTAALIVLSLSMLAGASTMTGVMRSITAFAVFTAFGIVLRYLLGDSPGQSAQKGSNQLENPIEPGSKVGEIMNDKEDNDNLAA